MVGPGTISEKCRYALRAIFDLALRDATSPVKIQDIAAAQGIPQRFLEIILAELKHGGFVGSQRGADGGYILLRLANELTIGEIIRFMQGSDRRKVATKGSSYLAGDYVFDKLWREATKVVADVYDNITFADLVEQELVACGSSTSDYVI